MGEQAERLLRICATRLEPMADHEAIEHLLGRRDAPSKPRLLRVQRGAKGWEHGA